MTAAAMPPNGDWMQTASGRAIYPLAPDPALICLDDIAHALALQCRFAGHTRSFYSVAQHSVLVSQVAPFVDAFAGLMHDATEAYVQDLIRPIKRGAGMSGYHTAEIRVWGAMCVRYDMSAVVPAGVKLSDEIVLATEKRDLMRSSPKAWEALPPPMDEVITPWPWDEAEWQFKRRFGELQGADGCAAIVAKWGCL